MYLSESQKEQLIAQNFLRGDETCSMCATLPVILWELGSVRLLLCGEHAQYLGTHLLKDVRAFEIAQGKSIKVRMETRAHANWNVQ